MRVENDGPAGAATAGVKALADVAPTPWRNGGGVGRDLLNWPQAADVQVRINVAEIERDGPFSDFSGWRRLFAIVGGAGVDLWVDAAPQRVTAATPPLSFDGGAAPDCRCVAGPTRALNLVVRQGGTATGASMQRIEGTASWAADCAELMAVYAETGGVQIQRGAATEVLAAQQLGWRRLAAGERVAVQAASAWVMRVPLAAP